MTCAADNTRVSETTHAWRRLGEVLVAKNLLTEGGLERALSAQERLIAYRQSFRWWIALPWMRVKLAWARLTDR